MLTYAIVLILVMICTYNPAIKSRITALWNKVKPKKKDNGPGGKPRKKKAGKEAA